MPVPNTANVLMTIPLVAAQREIREVKVSGSNQGILTADYYSYLYLSNPAGNVWTPLSGTNNTGAGVNEIGKESIHISNDGTRIMTVNNKIINQNVWFSQDSGASFSAKTLPLARIKKTLGANSVINFFHAIVASTPGTGSHFNSIEPFTSFTSSSIGSLSGAYYARKLKRTTNFLFANYSNINTIYKYFSNNTWASAGIPGDAGGGLKIAIAESESTGYVCSASSGKIYRITNLFYTSSFAPTFTEIYQDTSKTWIDIVCNNGDGLTVVAITAEGTVVISKDGGVNWSSIEVGESLVACDVSYGGGRIVVASATKVYDIVYTETPLPPLVIETPSKVNIQVVNALPIIHEPTTLYMLKGNNATDLKIYMSSKDGNEVRHVPMITEIEAMISDEITAATQLKVVADITARNAIDFGDNTTLQVLVLDATADATVNAGTATYIGRKSGETITWTKISETESLDVVLQWAQIIDGPISSIEQIDDTVFNIHVHANKAVLDNLGTQLIDTGLELTYNGEVVSIIVTSEWD